MPQVRGSTSPAEEMAYIISNSDSCGVIVQDSATLERALPAIAPQPNTNGNSNGAAKVGAVRCCPRRHLSVWHVPDF